MHRVSAAELREVFMTRMNTPSILPTGFDLARKVANDLWARAAPSRTEDLTPEGFFRRRFTVQDIGGVKERIRANGLHKARGPDGIGYRELLRIDDEDLRMLFQQCVDDLDAPERCLVSYLAAMGKKGKDLSDPNNYRTIGLESALVKFLTFLIDRRLREWEESRKILPPSQNGFRKGHRTNNNAFVLRTAIDEARSKDRTLYVLFVDLTNAFPSVNQPTLWRKLHLWGAQGPVIDWLRMLYSRMRYVVRFGGTYTESFKATAGILIGDPASPVLWNLYLADFWVNVQADDVTLAGVQISHLEQADDIVLFAYSPEALQSKLNDLLAWCRLNFMLINATKTKCMIFGPLPLRLPCLRLQNATVEVVSSYTYVGILFDSTKRFIFAQHLQEKARKARKMANSALSIESYVGEVPAWVLRELYMTRVDPHLTYGSEVIVDVDEEALRPSVLLQHTFLRRLLGLNPRSVTVTLFTETGLQPLRYRRVLLSLRYLLYLLKEKPELPHLALQQSLALAEEHHSSWVGDLIASLLALPVPVSLDFRGGLSEPLVNKVMEDVLSSLHAHIEHQLHENTRLPLVYGRTHWDQNSRKPVNAVLAFREYLHLPSLPLRHAIARLVCADHPFAVEQLRRTKRKIAREDRICRFCEIDGVVETEIHVLLHCTDDRLARLRNGMLTRIFDLVPSLQLDYTHIDGLSFLRKLLGLRKVLPVFGNYLTDIFTLCTNIPMYASGTGDGF